MDVDSDASARLKALPPAHALLDSDAGRALAASIPHEAAREVVRRVLDELRRDLLAGNAPVDRAVLTDRALIRLSEEAARARTPRLRRVINATGVVLHTNLGRAPLGEYVLDHIRDVAQGYATLEYDLAAGKRGHRDRLISEQLASLLGTEDALVVNNNAAAVLLTATALGAGREIIVSRGELVEIGGGFRVPDIIAACGAKLVEVGTTNRTRIEDYERAITDATAMLLRVHRSNFAIVGFTVDTPLEALAALGASREIPVVEDLGSGALIDMETLGLPHEPTARDSLALGVDLVMTSGDKLLGGPQAGIIAGKRTLIERLRNHPLARAMRPGRLVFAALEATVRAYSEGVAAERIPVIAMLSATDDVLRVRAAALAGEIRAALEPRVIDVHIKQCEGRIGGGSMPTARLPSWSVRVSLPGEGRLSALERGLRRSAEPPVVARIADGHLVFDVRTVADSELKLLARGLARALVGIQEQFVDHAGFGANEDTTDDGDDDAT